MADDVRAAPIRSLSIAPVPQPDSSEAGRRLPTPLTSFVDREREQAALAALLRRDDARLVTLIGPGGVGKTRLALTVARGLRGAFADGVVFVPLEAVKEPELAPVRIAHALAIRDDGQSAATRLQAALRDQHLLVILDNFEQVLDAAPFLADLLDACPRVKLLVTSRARLNLSGERVMAVTPLAVPEPGQATTPEQLLASPSVRLFVERAQAADADFALSAANADPVATICRQLDGLPLAIELAAARSAALSPPALLAGLTARLQLLSGGPRDAPARLRAMRDAVAWSDNLLIEEERTFFRRLAVFAGGFTMEAAGAVAAGAAAPVVVLLGSLIDKSLVYRLAPQTGASRFGMLGTIREYALERLEASGEADDVRRSHAGYFLAFGEAAEALRIDLTAIGRVPLAAERDNFRAALRWLAHHDIEGMLRLAGALWPLWLEQGGIGPGRTQLAEFLALPNVHAPRQAWAKAASVAGALAQAQGDHRQAVQLSGQALDIAREIGDDRCAGMALTTLGLIAMVDGDLDRAESLLEAGLTSFRVAGDARALWTLRHLGSVAFSKRDLPKAIRVAEEGLALARAAGNDLDAARLLHNLGRAVAVQGHCERAIDHWRAAIVLFQEAGDSWGVADALYSLGRAAYEQGRLDDADSLLAQSLTLFRDIGDPEGTALALSIAGWLARARGAALEAEARFHDVLALLGDRPTRAQAANALLGLGAVAFDRGDLPAAARRWREALQRAQARGDQLLIASALERIAHLAAATGSRGQAVRLLAAGAALRAEIGAPAPPGEAREHDRLSTMLVDMVDQPEVPSMGRNGGEPAEAASGAADETAALLRDAAAVVASILAPSAEPATAPEARLLSAREREVLRLLTEGRTDREIAEILSLSYRTVTTHVTAILTKLNVDSRTAAAVLAVRRGLV